MKNLRGLTRILYTILISLVVFGPVGAKVIAKDVPRKVLLIGIDGCRFDSIKAANTPNLDLILERASWSQKTRVLPPRHRMPEARPHTSHGPGWATALSGVWHDKHGILSDSFDGPEVNEYDLKSEYESVYPYIFEVIRNQDRESTTASISTWEPLNHFIGRKATFQKQFSSNSGLSDDKILSPSDFDRMAAEEFQSLLLKQKAPEFTFLLLSQVNHEGLRSQYGPDSPSYLNAVEKTDALVGRVVKAISARVKEVQEEWLILITSDHGGEGSHHQISDFRSPNIDTTFLIAFGPTIDSGEIEGETGLVDVTALALDHLGIVVETLNPPIDGTLPHTYEHDLAAHLTKLNDQIDENGRKVALGVDLLNFITRHPTEFEGGYYEFEGNGALVQKVNEMNTHIGTLEAAAFSHVRAEMTHTENIFKFSLYVILPVFLLAMVGMVSASLIQGKSLETTMSFFKFTMNPSPGNTNDYRVHNRAVEEEDFSWIENEDHNVITSPEYTAAYTAFQNNRDKSGPSQKTKRWFVGKKGANIQVG